MKNTASFLTAPRMPAAVTMWVGGLLLMLCLWYLLLRGQMDLICALLIFITLLVVSVYNKITGAIMTLGYLTLMGDFRRMVAASFGQPKFDLLLVVAPSIAFLLAFPMLLKLRFKERLSKAMFALLIVMILEVFNPQQGGVTVGISGALFYIVPVLWFWIGRRHASPGVVGRLLYGCIFPLALFAFVLGLFQTYVGFLPYQQMWINLVQKSYTSLHVGGSIRAFGFSVSSAEYAVLLEIAAAATAAAYFGSKRIWAYASPLLILGMVLASSRGLVVRLIFTLAIVWTLRQGQKLDTKGLVRLGAFTAIGLIGVFGLASHFSSSASPTYQKGDAAQNALEHQASGLAHPLDQRSSSAGVHVKMIANGLLQGIIDPIGHGLGSTTLSSKKFGPGGTLGSSEIDFSDMFISLGLAGGIVYLYVIFESIRYTLLYIRKVPKTVGMPVLAILASTATSWLIGGQYSTSSMIFFLIGALVYEENRTIAEAPLFVRSYIPKLTSPSVV
jgi:hypothetical protein